MKTFLRQSFLQAGVLLLLALLPALGTVFLHPHGPVLQQAPMEVELAEVLAWTEPVLWLDARETPEFEAEHIPGALNLNETDWDDLIDDVLDAWKTDTRVVVYCRGGGCEASRTVATRLAKESGLSGLYLLKGGIESWQHAQ